MTAPDARTSDAPGYRASTAPVSGPFVWHDLMSTDPAAAIAFYSALFDWRMETRAIGGAGAGGGAATYTYIHAGERAFGGVVPLDARHGLPSHWVSYVRVDDVDDTCSRALATGGRTCIPPTDIPNVGRFAMIEDPCGAVLSPIALPATPAITTPSPPPPGAAWWHELAAPDPGPAAAFYRAVFGWRVHEAPSADGSTYWLFLRDDAPVGGMYRIPARAAFRANWMIFVAVPDADAAVERAVALGATPTFACVDVPGTGRVAGLRDPLGATIAIGRPERGHV